MQGILVTEAVRGEGGILRNKNGERFMEKYDPKRMELSTRDVVARAIYTEVREGRGSEHGGAFLDISQKPAEYVKKKLPSMYHQFLELADVDITKGPMEVGPTCHYVMGGVRVDPETAAVDGAQDCTPQAKSPRDCMARIAWAAIPFLTCWFSAGGRVWPPLNAAKKVRQATIDQAQIDEAEREMLAPFQNGNGESPYAIHRDLQETMQKLVGIFRVEGDLRASFAGA